MVVDEIGCFLSIFCFFFLPLQGAMAIFDRYPLIDGTFFLSPKQYTNKCIPVSETRSNVFETTRRNSNRVKDRANKKKECPTDAAG